MKKLTAVTRWLVTTVTLVIFIFGTISLEIASGKILFAAKQEFSLRQEYQELRKEEQLCDESIALTIQHQGAALPEQIVWKQAIEEGLEKNWNERIALDSSTDPVISGFCHLGASIQIIYLVGAIILILGIPFSIIVLFKHYFNVKRKIRKLQGKVNFLETSVDYLKKVIEEEDD